jgi:hypothetical protein
MYYECDTIRTEIAMGRPRLRVEPTTQGETPDASLCGLTQPTYQTARTDVRMGQTGLGRREGEGGPSRRWIPDRPIQTRSLGPDSLGGSGDSLSRSAPSRRSHAVVYLGLPLSLSETGSRRYPVCYPSGLAASKKRAPNRRMSITNYQEREKSMSDQLKRAETRTEPLSFRASNAVMSQLEDLMEEWGENRTQALSRCVSEAWLKRNIVPKSKRKE